MGLLQTLFIIFLIIFAITYITNSGPIMGGRESHAKLGDLFRMDDDE